MIKLVGILLAIIVACNALSIGNVGGYIDRPELLRDTTVVSMIYDVIYNMYTESKVALNNVKITRVQTQLVRGTNYKIDFVDESVAGQKTTCQVVVNVNFDSVKSILQSQCQTT